MSAREASADANRFAFLRTVHGSRAAEMRNATRATRRPGGHFAGLVSTGTSRRAAARSSLPPARHDGWSFASTHGGSSLNAPHWRSDAGTDAMLTRRLSHRGRRDRPSPEHGRAEPGTFRVSPDHVRGTRWSIAGLRTAR